MIRMKINADLTKIIKKKHEQKWIALSKDRHVIVGSGSNLPTLRKKLGNKKDDVIYMKALSS